MANVHKAKGTAWETACVNYLRTSWGMDARRKVQAGRADVGDISIEELPDVVVEAKNHKAISLASFVDQANQEAHNARASFGIVFIKRAGKADPKDGYAVMDIETFGALMRDLIEGREAIAELESQED